ncbi:hypothetical protein A8135_13760 [Legionella jamestowniensis]|uniref:Polysaccharide chain length determinant N-terminal domain-containing protein n=1 Tax=Legionella jamestowniensis TaxID=455 RepID=A0ABX2XTH0_9GAMM|nr:Wzz/FepE/Etk N-terminal domain-containing protein [Legionella jamestowniensis]OCH97556.1 hypothetical protein A8135_13760 [Legionella jamestowniensis]
MKNQPVSVNYQPEIDLIEVGKLLWQRKWFISGFTLVVSIIVLMLAYSVKPLFQAELTIIPPIVSDIAALNIGRESGSILKPYTPTDVFTIFRGVLFSDSAKQSYLKQQEEKNKLRNIKQTVFPVVTKVQPLSRYSVMVTAYSPEEVEQNLKDFIALIKQKTKQQITQAVEHDLRWEKIQYMRELTILKEFAQIKHKSKDLRSEKAFKLTKKMDRNSPHTSLIDGSSSLQQNKQNLQDKPLKMDADTTFSKKLEQLQLNHKRVSNNKLNIKDVLLARVDDEIVIKKIPNTKKLKLLFFMIPLSLIVACIWVMFNSYKKPTVTL